MNKKEHWESVYTHKQPNEVSWYQQTPQVSLEFVGQLRLGKNAAIIDVGGGDSLLVDHLLALGYTNISVLDISEAAIHKSQQRLGSMASSVNWIVSDILNYVPDRVFDFWHDRATFHFLTTEEQVQQYLAIAQQSLAASGKMVIGTFSANGPEKCSGLPVKQYTEDSLPQLLNKWFAKLKCIAVDHLTPFNTLQNFLFCSFKKI